MIVQPDFLDHWKTRMLIGILKDESAPLILLRLWAYCQQQKRWVITGMKDETLKVICRLENPRVSLLEVLITCGFLKDKDGELHVNDWDSYNSKLIAAWKNGAIGGRPKNPQVPVGSSDENRLDRIGQDKIGKDGKEKGGKKKTSFNPPNLEEFKTYCSEVEISESDATAMFYKWEGNGWKNGGAGIVSWKGTLRSWKAHGYLPSQKKSENGHPVAKSDLSTHPGNPEWIGYKKDQVTQEQRNEFSELKRKTQAHGLATAPQFRS